MSDRIALIVVLAEDKRQFTVIRRYLQRDHDPRQIRPNTAPAGAGSAEQYVRREYAREVREFRNRAGRSRQALVVAIDADTRTVDQRRMELAQALADGGESARRDDEAIALVVPRRQVETWILCLNGETVDETTSYRRRDDIDGKISIAANRLFDWSRDNYVLPENCVDSLRRALPELRRV